MALLVSGVSTPLVVRLITWMRELEIPFSLLALCWGLALPLVPELNWIVRAGFSSLYTVQSKT